MGSRVGSNVTYLQLTTELLHHIFLCPGSLLYIPLKFRWFPVPSAVVFTYCSSPLLGVSKLLSLLCAEQGCEDFTVWVLVFVVVLSEAEAKQQALALVYPLKLLLFWCVCVMGYPLQILPESGEKNVSWLRSTQIRLLQCGLAMMEKGLGYPVCQLLATHLQCSGGPRVGLEETGGMSEQATLQGQEAM